MSAAGHDPLCPNAVRWEGDIPYCQCPLIAEVRADERERIAQALESQADELQGEAACGYLAAAIARAQTESTPPT